MSGMNEHHDGTEHDHEAMLEKYKLPNIALNLIFKQYLFGGMKLMVVK